MTMIKLIQPDEVLVRDVRFLSGGQKLVGQLFHPVQTPRAAVVLNPATAVTQRFYRPFAEWLVRERGMACLLYDYRDFGASARGHVRKSRATMVDWGVHDQQAARDFMRAQMPGVPLWVIGHSLGALLIPFQQNLDNIDRLITVASGPVHVSEHPWPYQALARLFWYGAGPVATLGLGYLPGKRLGIGRDLPPEVYWQWRNFCTRRDFATRDIGASLPYPDWSSLRAPAKFVAVEDDVMVPPLAVWRSMDFYRGAPKSQKTLRPEAYGLNAIGHIGVFDSRNAACWGDIIA